MITIPTAEHQPLHRAVVNAQGVSTATAAQAAGHVRPPSTPSHSVILDTLQGAERDDLARWLSLHIESQLLRVQWGRRSGALGAIVPTVSKLSLNHPFVRILTHELHQYIGAFADRAMVQALEEHESFEALLDQVALVVHEDNRDYFVLNCVDAVRQTLRDTAAHRAQAWSQGDA